jgi:D-arabinose 1-dehydrogenase-like Zn-dependent alcohol dehydrogenase
MALEFPGLHIGGPVGEPVRDSKVSRSNIAPASPAVGCWRAYDVGMSPATMRAVLIEDAGGPLRVRAIPVPEPGPGEVLVRVGGCAVDRFDLAIRNGVRERATELPHILGHEIAGEVARLGPGVSGLTEGDRVASSLYLVCGRCRWCLRGRETICENFGGHVGVNVPGGYAEYVVLPARNLASIPDELDFVPASILANAIGTPYHALAARMDLRPGDRLVVTGAGGGVGLHAVQLGVLLGAAVLAVDIGPHKLSSARELGADAGVDPTETDLGSAIREWTGGRGADGVLELVGPATLPATLNSLAKGGKMVIVGSHTGSEWTIDPGDVYRSEWEILGSRNVSVDELRTVVDLVARGAITPVVDRTGSLDQAEELQDRVREGAVVGRDVLVP